MEKIKVKLYSLDESQYLDLTVICKKVDVKEYASHYLDFLQSTGKAVKQAKKFVYVKARPAVVGEEIKTSPIVERDGKLYYLGETKSVVKVEGSMVVENPMGEKYIVKPNVFAQKYKETEKKGIYLSTGEPINYIDLKEDIVFTASWGEEMVGLNGGVLVVSNLDDIYAIQNKCFEDTYKVVNNKENEID